MSTDIVIKNEKTALLMKSGLVHWVNQATGHRVQEHLIHQQAHGFLNIAELNITINTSELEGVYTPAEYENVSMAKQGYWQCPYRKWHMKRSDCQCKNDWFRKQREEKRERDEEQARSELTDEQRAANSESLAKHRKILEDKGVLPKKMPGGEKVVGHTIKRSALNAYKKKHGVEYTITDGTLIDEDVK